MLNDILHLLKQGYGDLSLDEMKARMRADGLGELVDVAEELFDHDPELAKSLADRSFPMGALIEEGMNVMPPSPAPAEDALVVEAEDDIRFDQRACLTSCAGNCCRNKNYLMISLADIYRIVSSRAAQRLGIHSTVDLFDRVPPLVQLFFSAEYGVFLPYIRFLPVGTDPKVHPEDAPASVCPFLLPIAEVCAMHDRNVPEWAGAQAWGCSLLRHKPQSCRLSPLGKSTGLVTGKVTYEYVPPALECPACETDVVVKVADHLSDSVSRGERKLDERSFQVLKATARKPLAPETRRRFNRVLQQLYNIDALLLQHGLQVHHRPRIDRIIETAILASRGEFGAYDELVGEFARLGRAPGLR